MWHREGRKMAIGQCRSAISFDDVAQKTTLARSAHQNNAERTSKLVEEQCDEFVPLGSVRFQGLKTIDVIERNGPPKNSVALEPGDLEVDFVRFFPILLRSHFFVFLGGGSKTTPEWPRYGHKMAPRGPKMAPTAPQRPQDSPKMPLGGPKVAPEWSNMVYTCPPQFF